MEPNVERLKRTIDFDAARTILGEFSAGINWSVLASKRENSSLDYLPALDGLRAVAVLSVIFGHARIPGFSAGGMGVDVFFVLSGYLITRVLLVMLSDKRAISEFYWSRFTRLFPPLLLTCLSLYLLPDSYLTKWGATLNTLGALSYVSNWTRAFPVIGWPSYMAHSWSLSVEEQFYLLWPGIIFAISKFANNRMSQFVFGMCFLSIAWVCTLVLLGASKDHIYNGSDARCAPIMIGSSLAFIPLLRPGKIIVASAVVAYFGAVAFLTRTVPTAAAVWLASVVLLEVARDPNASGIVSRILRWRPFVFIGTISYALYLWHFPIFIALDRAEIHPLISAPVGIGLSFALAYLTRIFVEVPFLNIRNSVRGRSRIYIGRLCFALTFFSFIAGMVFFFGGFIKDAPY